MFPLQVIGVCIVCPDHITLVSFLQVVVFIRLVTVSNRILAREVVHVVAGY